jgi:hypothetical protein
MAMRCVTTQSAPVAEHVADEAGVQAVVQQLTQQRQVLRATQAAGLALTKEVRSRHGCKQHKGQSRRSRQRCAAVDEVSTSTRGRQPVSHRTAHASSARCWGALRQQASLSRKRWAADHSCKQHKGQRLGSNQFWVTVDEV